MVAGVDFFFFFFFFRCRRKRLGWCGWCGGGHWRRGCSVVEYRLLGSRRARGQLGWRPEGLGWRCHAQSRPLLLGRRPVLLRHRDPCTAEGDGGDPAAALNNRVGMAGTRDKLEVVVKRASWLAVLTLLLWGRCCWAVDVRAGNWVGDPKVWVGVATRSRGRCCWVGGRSCCDTEIHVQQRATGATPPPP